MTWKHAAYFIGSRSSAAVLLIASWACFNPWLRCVLACVKGDLWGMLEIMLVIGLAPVFSSSWHTLRRASNSGCSIQSWVPHMIQKIVAAVEHGRLRVCGEFVCIIPTSFWVWGKVLVWMSHIQQLLLKVWFPLNGCQSYCVALFLVSEAVCFLKIVLCPDICCFGAVLV